MNDTRRPTPHFELPALFCHSPGPPAWRPENGRSGHQVCIMLLGMALLGPVVVALDVDGVLNAFKLSPRRQEHKIYVPPEAVPRSPYVQRDVPGGGITLTIRIDPSDGEWVTSLRQRAEVVWATTWEDAANVVLAPLLGTEPLAVGARSVEEQPRFGELRYGDSTSWKQRVLSRRYRHHPIVFVDDRASHHGRDLAPRAPSLIVSPDPDVGLTGREKARIERFVDTWAERVGLPRALSPK